MVPPETKVSMPLAPSSTRVALLPILPAGAGFAGLTSRTVMVTVSEAAATPLETVRVNTKSVSADTPGAVNVVEPEKRSAMRTAGLAGLVWFHRYVRVASASSSSAVPTSVTVSPSLTVWSAPAFTVGALLVRRSIWTPWSPDEETAA